MRLGERVAQLEARQVAKAVEPAVEFDCREVLAELRAERGAMKEKDAQEAANGEPGWYGRLHAADEDDLVRMLVELKQWSEAGELWADGRRRSVEERLEDVRYLKEHGVRRPGDFDHLRLQYREQTGMQEKAKEEAAAGMQDWQQRLMAGGEDELCEMLGELEQPAEARQRWATGRLCLVQDRLEDVRFLNKIDISATKE